MRACVGAVLGAGARRVAACLPCACGRPAPAHPAGPPDGHRPPGPQADPGPEGPTGAPGPLTEEQVRVPAGAVGAGAPAVELPSGGEVPPGPWRWRWVWATPSRPAGMALVAADGTLVLWSPGGFATPGDPSDGRPTPDVASALADLPDLTEAAAGAEDLLVELRRARRAAAETRQLLTRAADAVDDEIGRAARATEPRSATDPAS